MKALRFVLSLVLFALLAVLASLAPQTVTAAPEKGINVEFAVPTTAIYGSRPLKTELTIENNSTKRISFDFTVGVMMTPAWTAHTEPKSQVGTVSFRGCFPEFQRCLFDWHGRLPAGQKAKMFFRVYTGNQIGTFPFAYLQGSAGKKVFDTETGTIQITEGSGPSSAKLKLITKDPRSGKQVHFILTAQTAKLENIGIWANPFLQSTCGLQDGGATTGYEQVTYAQIHIWATVPDDFAGKCGATAKAVLGSTMTVLPASVEFEVKK